MLLRLWLYLLLPIVVSLRFPSAQATGTVPDNFAESVMIFALSADGTEEFSLRLARFPDRGLGTVWLHVAGFDGAWSLADETFELDTAGMTPVHAETAAFAARQGQDTVLFESFDRNSGQLRGRIRGRVQAAKTRHPGLGPGSDRVTFDLAFHADSPGFVSRSDRRELTGRITGTVGVPGGTIAVDFAGKWHEQTGPRARFAPAFTYFNVFAPAGTDGVAMLVVAFRDRVDGYARIDGRMHGIRSFSIDDAQSRPDGIRRFRGVLTNDRLIEGTARVVQAWSVPIEGRRRPGSSVLVESSAGPLLGTLNDWNPDD